MIRIFVPHVSSGYEERATHIEGMMKRHGLDFDYILDGDISDITPQVLEEYFSPQFGGANAFTSCTYKHLLAYRRIVDENLPGALIVEDDVVFLSRFSSLLPEAIRQLEAEGDRSAILSFEDTRLRFVPRSKRSKERLIYRGDRDRLAGCYYINRAGAQAVIDYARKNKFDRPIDTFHRLMLDRGLIDYWWMQPATATQGSFTGLFPSALSKRYGRLLTPVVWQMKLAYHKLLYWLR